MKTIKNYNQFNESLLNKLQGPSEEDVWDNYKSLKPNELLYKSAKSGFLNGVIKAIEMGANVNDCQNIKDYFDVDDDDDDDYDYNFSVIEIAAAYNQLNIIKYLIEHNINKEYINDALSNMRFDPDDLDNLDTVKYLLKNGADLDYACSGSFIYINGKMESLISFLRKKIKEEGEND